MVCGESHLVRLPTSLREGRVLEWGCMRLFVVGIFLNNLPLVKLCQLGSCTQLEINV